MNLYVNHDKQATLGGHVCSIECNCTSTELLDAEGTAVGYVTQKVGYWLVTKGVAMDVTERSESR